MQAETFLTERQQFRVSVATPAHLLLEVVSIDRDALLPLILGSSEQNVSHLGMAWPPQLHLEKDIIPPFLTEIIKHKKDNFICWLHTDFFLRAAKISYRVVWLFPYT
jgi:hypothetical protein